MKLVSMKRTPEEKKKDETVLAAPCCGTEDGPDYPYGLRICLSEREMEKLGIAGANVGDVLNLAAAAKVVSASASEHEGGRRIGSIELLLTDIGLEKPDGGKDAASVLYTEVK